MNKNMRAISMMLVILGIVGMMTMSAMAGPSVANSAASSGVLSITTTPVVGNIYVDGVFEGAGTWTGRLQIGSHTVYFSNVPGYTTPLLQGVVVNSKHTVYVTGVYTPTQPVLQINIPSPRYVTQLLTISITNKANGNAIVGADVKVCLSSTSTCLTFKTDTNGHIVFIPQNINYQIWATAPGYQSAYTTFTVANPLPQYSVKAVVISGKVYVQVLNENNKPVVGATVSEGTWAIISYFYSYVTNANGLAGIHDVSPGSYTVKLTVPGIGVRYYPITIPVYEVPK